MARLDRPGRKPGPLFWLFYALVAGLAVIGLGRLLSLVLAPVQTVAQLVGLNWLTVLSIVNSGFELIGLGSAY